jgi:hypothetical protein
MRFYSNRFYCGHCGCWVKVDEVDNRRGRLFHRFCGSLVRVVPRNNPFRNRLHEKARNGDVLIGVELYNFLRGGVG